MLHEWELPERIVEKPGKHVWKDHLFATEQSEFAADLNGWEKAFVKWTDEQPDFVCWLRNLPRRDWAFCVPYEKGGEKPFYPDFIIVRKKANGFLADVLEPHDPNRLDTWAKVQGLAKFADEHEVTFGRLMVGRRLATFCKSLTLPTTKLARRRERWERQLSPWKLSLSLCQNDVE